MKMFRVPKTLRSSNIRKFASSQGRSNNAQDIERLNLLIKQKLAEIEASGKKRIVDENKPKLSDFKRPLLTTFVIGSTAYITLHLIWWHLEYPERENQLKIELEQKEHELKELAKEKRDHRSDGPHSKRNLSWSPWRLWKDQ